MLANDRNQLRDRKLIDAVQNHDIDLLLPRQNLRNQRRTKTARISFNDRGNCAYKDVRGCWSWTANSRARASWIISRLGLPDADARWPAGPEMCDLNCGSIRVCSKNGRGRPPKRESVASIASKIEAHHVRSSLRHPAGRRRHDADEDPEFKTKLDSLQYRNATRKLIATFGTAAEPLAQFRQFGNRHCLKITVSRRKHGAGCSRSSATSWVSLTACVRFEGSAGQPSESQCWRHTSRRSWTGQQGTVKIIDGTRAEHVLRLFDQRPAGERDIEL